MLYKRRRELVYNQLGIPLRMAPGFTRDLSQPVDVGMVYAPERITVYAQVFVTGAQSGRKHRVFALCPLCSTVQPLSRIHQHYGSQLCKDKQNV